MNRNISWEDNILEVISNYIKEFAPISKDCQLGTVYKKTPEQVFETHTEYSPNLVNGVELRIRFDFEDSVDLTKVEFDKSSETEEKEDSNE